jgi:transposase InsO family protein
MCRQPGRGLGQSFHFYNTARYHQAWDYRTPHSVHWAAS